LSSSKQRREEAEKRMKELNDDVQNIEEILHSQTHPTDLVVVRKSGTPVLAKSQANASVLFPADAEDEFQLLGRQGGWVHVEVSGVSRGWIRRAQVDLPEGFTDSPPRDSDAPFRVAHEETHAFPGDWQQLRGRSVRIIWVEPASNATQTSSGQAKRDFAKSLFLKAYKEVSSADQPVAGAVIVFDSADGGQISATLSSLADWQAGNLAEASFWQQCSLDPPESFQPASKP
jgi:N-methylhydantoinase A/oxoprolinase/acetone carboxylase beta subunit